MHVKGFLHKLLSSVMSQKRLASLILLVEGLLIAKKLSITELGKGINHNIQVRSGIRRADRFIGNIKLRKELKNIYIAHSSNLIGTRKKPQILIDWTHVPNTDFHALRAALVSEGRSLTLYDEVHSEKKLGNVRVEKKFLATLKELVPEDCRPIIITDAGFRNPWFKQVTALGWDFVGRIRGTHKYKDDNGWWDCKTLYSKATKRAKHIGKVFLCKRNTIIAHLFLLKERSKKASSRKKYKKKTGGKRDTLNYKKSAKDPWLLASSLPGNSPVKIKRVIQLYKMRMQIEEGFRDLKNPKYGFGLRNAYSRSKERIEILLLIAMLASLIALLTGYVAEKNKWQFQFQSSSIKTRRVLSLFFLGCEVIKQRLAVSVEMLEMALKELQIISRAII